MERIAKSLTELIGNTPLLELSNWEKKEGLKARLLAKVEAFNPAGSVKDRVARAMIEDAEARGLLAVNGLGMLIHQAVLAFSFLTGADVDALEMPKILYQAVRNEA